jgi:hypothetical protein
MGWGYTIFRVIELGRIFQDDLQWLNIKRLVINYQDSLLVLRFGLTRINERHQRLASGIDSDKVLLLCSFNWEFLLNLGEIIHVVYFSQVDILDILDGPTCLRLPCEFKLIGVCLKLLGNANFFRDFVLQLEWESECRSYVRRWFKIYLASKLPHNLFGNDKT